MADDIKIELIVDSDGTVKAVKKVEDQASTSGKKAAKSLEKNLNKAGNNIKSGFKSTFAAVAGFAAAAFAGKEIISAAAQQEAAVSKLNAALRSSGNFSEQTSKELQNFASQLQSVSTIGDEVILDQLGFSQAMGATVDQSKEIVKAAADMSAALGIDMESATRNITKTLGGLKGELGETIPELGSLTKEQLQSGAAIDIIAKKFGGFAQSEVKTFGGAMAQLRNSFGDLLENIGLSLIQSPKFIGLINLITKGINSLIKSFNVDAVVGFVDSAIVGFIDFVTAASVLAKPFIVMKNVAMLAFNSIRTVLQGLVVNVADSIALIANIPFADKIFPVEQINNFRDSARETLGEFTTAATESAVTLLENDMTVAETLTGTLERFRENVAGMKQSVASGVDTIVNKTKKGSDSVFNFGIESKKVLHNFSGNIKSAMVNATSLGVQALTKSLLLGQNGFKGFGQAIAGMLGDLATQMGSTLIASGLGIEALKSFGGAAAIAAGAGLVALGTILKSFSGGGGGAAPATTGASTDVTAVPTVGGPIETAELEDEEVATIEKEQRVQLVIQGDVFDSEETGTRLLSILNNEFENKNGRLVTA
tara:strand:- start:1422 stop:3206 length:1785 start_codon:yes stop_codon:yes gene_type:complete